MGTTQHILLIGAGKSATILIKYLGKITRSNQWICTVADVDLTAIQAKTNGFETLIAKELQVNDATAREELIRTADVVISMLPPSLHYLVATDCLKYCKHLLTASYIDEAIKQLEPAIVSADLLFLGEMGLDPGIDHMSIMKLIHQINSLGGNIHAVKSHCGGLVAPENDNNPWHYKISWNPRNVVTAGKAGAIYKDNHIVKHLPYQDIFSNCGMVTINGLGQLSYYPNRDSMNYLPLYGLNDVETFIRTTLRYPSFCSGWQKIIDLGLTTDDEIIDTDGLSYADLFHRLLADKQVKLDNEELVTQFKFLGLNNSKKINQGQQPNSIVLQHLLEEKWKLNKGDKDMIVMLHEIDYSIHGLKRSLKSTLIVKGDDEINTAMAKTVGLPLGIAATLLLQNKIAVRGLHIPIIEEIYNPVLKVLETEGIYFNETDAII